MYSLIEKLIIHNINLELFQAVSSNLDLYQKSQQTERYLQKFIALSFESQVNDRTESRAKKLQIMNQTDLFQKQNEQLSKEQNKVKLSSISTNTIINKRKQFFPQKVQAEVNTQQRSQSPMSVKDIPPFQLNEIHQQPLNIIRKIQEKSILVQKKQQKQLFPKQTKRSNKPLQQKNNKHKKKIKKQVVSTASTEQSKLVDQQPNNNNNNAVQQAKAKTSQPKGESNKTAQNKAAQTVQVDEQRILSSMTHEEKAQQDQDFFSKLQDYEQEKKEQKYFVIQEVDQQIQNQARKSNTCIPNVVKYIQNLKDEKFKIEWRSKVYS